MTNHIDQAAQVIYSQGAFCGECCYGQCTDPDCHIDGWGDCRDCKRIITGYAQALADAGLLMPDLPAPYEHRAWHAGIADVRRIDPRMEDGETLEVLVLHNNGRIFCSKEQARSLAYVLLAASQCAEKQASMTTLTACAHRLHAHPLPESYFAAHAEAGRRLSNGWRSKKCPECGIYGWEKP